MLIKCELCSDTAGVYCPSDSAYLCWSCDSSVHSANFLVARHARSTLCSSCGDFDGESFSGAGIRKLGSSAGCKSCGLSVYDEEESSLSSVCVSTNESSTVQARGGCGEVSRRERRGRAKAEGVLVNWGRRMGLGGEQSDVVLGRAAEVMRGVGACLPVRVALAAAFWVGLRLCGGETCRDLKRVERVTGVPGKMILAVEGKLERVLKTRRGMVRCDDDYEEGWAEC